MKTKLLPLREISVTKSVQGFHVGTVVGGRLLTRHFIGYSRREAVAAFREAVRDLAPIN